MTVFARKDSQEKTAKQVRHFVCVLLQSCFSRLIIGHERQKVTTQMATVRNKIGKFQRYTCHRPIVPVSVSLTILQ